MSFDGNIQVNVSLAQPVVQATSFGVPLFVAAEAGMGAGFTERIRFYTSQQAVTDDATDLGAVATAAATAMFDQELKPARIAVGRADLLAPETYAQALDAIVAALATGQNFWGVAIESRTDTDIASAAAWCLSNKRLFVPQSNDADILLAPETDVFGLLKTANNDFVHPMYHADDAEFADCAILANRLAVDPDVQTTIWSYATLVNVTPNKLTDTEMLNLLAKNANTYSTFYDIPSTGMGTVSDGTKADLILTREWTIARVTEALVNHLKTYSDLGLKIPYTNNGINTFGQKTLTVLNRGVSAGHFDPDYPPTVTMPKKADVADADIAARVLRYTFEAVAAGAIEKVVVTGTISVTLP